MKDTRINVGLRGVLRQVKGNLEGYKDKCWVEKDTYRDEWLVEFRVSVQVSVPAHHVFMFLPLLAAEWNLPSVATTHGEPLK